MTQEHPFLCDLNRYVSRCLASWGVPGCAVGVVRDGCIIHAKGYGLRDVSRNLPVDENTAFYIGSCTKALTATALGMLVDEGKLAWDRPVRSYLPAFAMHDPIATEQTTLRDLLTHQTGLPNHFGASPSRDRSSLIHILPHLQLCQPFRQGFRYCNKGYIAAGLLLEHITGTTWERFIRERIFASLGMRGSTFAACATSEASDFASGGRFAVGYLRKGANLAPWRHGWAKEVDLASLLRSVGPDGTVISNITDMCQWLRLQLDRGVSGDHVLVRGTTLDEIHSPHVTTPGWWSDRQHRLDTCYAMGWFVQTYRGHRCLFHGGAGVGFNAWVAFVPAKRIGVVVLSNCQAWPNSRQAPLDRLLDLDRLNWNGRERRRAREWEAKATRRRQLQDRMPGKDSLLLDAYSGEYSHPGYSRLSVFVETGELRMRHHGWPYERMHYRLSPCGQDEFRLIAPAQSDVQEARVSFRMDDAHRATAMAVPFEPAVSAIVFQRVSPGGEPPACRRDGQEGKRN